MWFEFGPMQSKTIHSSRKSSISLQGRGSCNKITVFDCDSSSYTQLLLVHTLFSDVILCYIYVATMNGVYRKEFGWGSQSRTLKLNVNVLCKQSRSYRLSPQGSSNRGHKYLVPPSKIPVDLYEVKREAPLRYYATGPNYSCI